MKTEVLVETIQAKLPSFIGFSVKIPTIKKKKKTKVIVGNVKNEKKFFKKCSKILNKGENVFMKP